MLYLYSLICYKKYMYISSMDIVIGLYQDVIIQALHYVLCGLYKYMYYNILNM